LRRFKLVGGLTAAAAIALGATACGSSSSGSSSSSSSGSGASAGGSKAPLVVGLVSAQSGPLATYGNGTIQGWKLAAQQANAQGGVDGHPVKIVTADTDGSPAATLRGARTAVLSDGAHYLSGIITSGESEALTPLLPGLKAINILNINKDDEVTGKACSANMYRVTTSASMDLTAEGQLLPQLAPKKWAVLVIDIATGHTAAQLFTQQASKYGKQVVSTQFAPLGTTDFGSYISKIKSSGADGLYVLESGADGIAFFNQAKQFALFSQIKKVLAYSTLNEPSFAALGKTVTGMYDKVNYTWTLDNPLNKTFVPAYEKAYGTKPWFIPADAYISAEFLFAAVEKAHSIDVPAVQAAMNGLSFNSIAGPVQMRAQDHQALRTVWVGQVVPQPGGWSNLGWKLVVTAPPSSTSPAPDPACKL
jgi:branched-chain amino acid transport system substrate-binding protein